MKLFCITSVGDGSVKQSGIAAAVDAPLPSSDSWEYVPDSANVDEEMDIHEIKES